MRKYRSFLAIYILIILACAISANVQAQPIVKIVISDNSFQPDITSIPVGTTVTWTNGDTVDHTVTSDNSAFHSGYIAPGRRFSHLFDKQGDYPYHCNIHPFMHGLIHVVPKSASESVNMPNSYQSAVSPKDKVSQSSASQYSQYYQSQTVPETASDTHIENPRKYDIQSNKPAYLYFRDQDQAVPYYQYQAYATQGGSNSLWVEGSSSWSQYATVSQGTIVSLIAATPIEGNGYLYETYPDGHTAKNYYYFFPYSQIGINLDTIGQHKLFFSKDDQMSNSIVIDVIGPGQISNVQPEVQKISYPQSTYMQPSHQQHSSYKYNSQGYQQSINQQESYQLQAIDASKEHASTEYNSYLEASIVKQDSNGQLTFDGIQGTDYDIYPSDVSILARGLFYNGIAYILVANPYSDSATFTVDPGISNWNVQSAQVKYGNLMIAKANNLLQITVPSHQSGLIIVQPQKKRYSFSVGPKPAYSFSAGQKPAYSFRAGPKPQYSFRAGY